MKKQNVLFSLSALLALGLTAMPVLANSAAGTLAGEVTDPSGSVVAGAKVVISRGAFAQTVQTDQTGQYTVKNLAPGKYEVAVSYDGFDTFDRAGLNVVAGHETKMDAPLDLAPLWQTVTVR